VSNTQLEYSNIQTECSNLFYAKAKDYGTSWRVMRLPSLLDQIFIKAKRIRSIQENVGEQKVNDPIRGDYIGIINYCIMMLIQMELGVTIDADENVEAIFSLYNINFKKANQIMLDKNHDYGEAWRNMNVESFIDLILSRIARLKQIFTNKHTSEVSEGPDSNLYDMVNYAIFALIRLD